MARYILDTGILLGYLRGAQFAAYVEQCYSPFNPPNVAAMSVVSIGELYSLATQLNWGDEKRNKLAGLLQKVPGVNIYSDDVIRQYAEIDAFSQGKHPNKILGTTSRNMGKNDLWIAATASVLHATLLTTDDDFDHLNGVFLTAIYIDQSSKPA
jgi:predicted nucleic acid-binding protein